MTQYRMAWSHPTKDGIWEGHGPTSPKLTQTMMASVAFGNRNHGQGSHWIERLEQLGDNIWVREESHG